MARFQNILGTVGHTPVVRINRLAPEGVNLYVKIEAFNPLGSVITPNLFPGVSISADLGNGPGIQEVATFSVDVSGPHGKVAVSNAHGTVTGAAGGVLLRPFARLISKAGDSVTTYGEPWNMN